eukprot:38642-Eustigmatos_ZCMA.PRE.1
MQADRPRALGALRARQGSARRPGQASGRQEDQGAAHWKTSNDYTSSTIHTVSLPSPANRD